MEIPEPSAIWSARERITPWLHRTPICTSATLDRLVGAELFFKAENLQKTGSFKARGAANAVFSMDEMALARGVATHSSGNHAQALAQAARWRGAPATVVMPRTAPPPKIAAVRDYGGDIITCEPTLTAREQALAEWVSRSGAAVVPPYDDPRVIAGQASCCLELLEQVEDLDAVIAPIGGGGLVSGTALACAATQPETHVYAAEPGNADDAYRSFHAGYIIEAGTPDTVADGLRTSLCALTFEIVSRHLRDILLASEAEILRAMRLIWERMKLVIEPSCAVPLATILNHAATFRGKRVGVILTGGNVDIDALPWQHASRTPA